MRARRVVGVVMASWVIAACASKSNKTPPPGEMPDGAAPPIEAGPAPLPGMDATIPMDAAKDSTVDPTCLDKVKNGAETDVDCGGGTCPVCADTKACAAPADCSSGVCDTHICLAPQPTDGVKNGDETDIDCGGSVAPKCVDGKTCVVGKDCKDGVCNAGVVALDGGVDGGDASSDAGGGEAGIGDGGGGRALSCQAPSYTDGVKNGTETDVDCGGSPAAPKCADRKICKIGTDCVSAACAGDNTCVSASCRDGAQDGDETDVDCGGPTCSGCADTQVCALPRDCKSGVCTGNKCTPPNNHDGVKNGDETDVDCGGTTTHAPPCADTKACAIPSDCVSLSCPDLVCLAATYTDHIKNGKETDVDCGGDPAHKCADFFKCAVGSDCVDGVCDPAQKVCSKATYTDGVQNGNETGIDCGGDNGVHKCADGVGCAASTDCTSGGCDMAVTPHVCKGASCTDGAKDGSETDVDCGGTCPNKCALNKGCAANTDCTTGACDLGTHTCATASYTDGVQDGPETDVDCGGDVGVHRCAGSKKCAANTDCASNACDPTMHCAIGPSCSGAATAPNGWSSCGAGEDGDANAKHESCCAANVLPNNAKVAVDKYYVTAGRMRAFLTSKEVNWNPHDWVSANVASLAAYVAMLPSDKASSYESLGPNAAWNGGNTTIQNAFSAQGVTGVRSGCNFGNNAAQSAVAARSFWSDPGTFDPSNEPHFAQVDLDEKALNCVTWPLAAAFCAWDGLRYTGATATDAKTAGRLPAAAEVEVLLHNNTAASGMGTNYPWGNTPDPDTTHVIHAFNFTPDYQFPMAYTKALTLATDNDTTWNLAAPGRKPAGTATNGWADAAGNLVPWVSTFNTFAFTQSFYTTGFDSGGAATTSKTTAISTFKNPNDADPELGFRCAHTLP